MFGFAKKLVNSIESQLSYDGSSDHNSRVDESRQGLRIQSVKPNSIGSDHGFESWFDFIVGLNGTDICAYLQLNTETVLKSSYSIMNIHCICTLFLMFVT